MIIKAIDGHAKDMATLKNILTIKGLTPTQKNQIETELSNIQKGEQAEKKAAYELDFFFKDHHFYVIIHDLRIEHEGRVAQIDHLIISRFFEFYVLESKYLSDEIIINNTGEFSAKYNNKIIGVSSPVVQNVRHINVLKALLKSKKIKLPTRLGFRAKPSFTNIITFSNNVKITRPKTGSVEWIDQVMKVENFVDFINKEAEKISIKDFLYITQVLSKDGLVKFAQDLAEQHKPLQMDWYARFGIEKPLPKPEPGQRQRQRSQSSKSQVVETGPKPTSKKKIKKKFFCDDCTIEISYVVARFCWFNKKRFNEKIYCRSCQENHK